MPKTSVELREERAALVQEARAKTDLAAAEDRELSPEESEAFDKFMAAVDELATKIGRMEKLEGAEVEAASAGERSGRPLDGETRTHRKTMTSAEYRATKQYAGVYGEWLKTGQIRMDLVPAEYRDTVLGTTAKGGFLVTPTQLAAEIVKQVDDLVHIRKLATVIRMGEATSLGIPQLGTRMADSNWTTEVAAVTEDTTQAFTRRDLTPVPLTKLAKVSIRMLYGMTGIESFLSQELGYKFAITEEKGFLTGSGSAQPLGVFTASANGVPVARDVSSGNTIAAIGADNLFNVKYSLKAGYLADPSCRWVFHRDAVSAIAKLKDSQNQYLWQPSIQIEQPDRLLGIPVLMSEYAPNTFTTGLYVGILGAFRHYWIAEVDDLQIQRLVELYAGTNEVGYIGRRFLDASPALGEAFARVKLA